MPITYAQIEPIIFARLDANQGNDRYLPEQDIIPAINSAVSRIQSAAGWALANRKGPEEMLRDFTNIAIYQTDGFGGVLLDDPLLPYTVANVVAVYVNPDLQTSGTITPLPLTESRYRSDLSWAGAGEPVLRITLEQAANTKNNASMRGNEVLAAIPGRRTYAYYQNNGRVWVIPKSVMSQQFVAIAHIEKFQPMTSTSSSVNLPEFLTELVATWSLEFLAVKQDTQGQGVGAFAQKDAAQIFGWTTN